VRHYTSSEDTGAEVNETIKVYERRARGNDVDDYFDDATGFGRDTVESLLGVIRQALGGADALLMAVELGIEVDQGVRPPDSMRYVFCTEPNREHWERKRSGKYRDAVAARRRAIGCVRRLNAERRNSSSEDDDEEAVEDEATEQDPVPPPPWLPAETRIGYRFWLTAHDAPDPEWSLGIRRLWSRLRIPAELPKPLYALHKREVPVGVIARIVGLIDVAAEDGFTHLEGTGVAPPRSRRAQPDGPAKARPRPAEPSTSTAPPVHQGHGVAVPRSDDRGGDTSRPATSDVVPEGPRTSPGSFTRPAVTAAEYERLREIKSEIDHNNIYIGSSLPIVSMFERIAELNKNLLRTESRRVPRRREGDRTAARPAPAARLTPVLILGPTGAGKTAIARLIHDHSNRDPELFTREQASDNRFGDPAFIKGRWAGYGKNHGVAGVGPNGTSGLLSEYAGGTIFIDELGKLTTDFQAFLLDILDGQPIAKTSGEGDRVVPDVRLIFATNADIDEAVKQGKLEHDLIDRLRRYTLSVPPLSEHVEDVFDFVRVRCEGYDPTPAFLLGLLRYGWPGNVRELIDRLDLAVRRTKRSGEELTLDHLQLPDSGIVTEIRRMEDREIEIERELYSQTAEILARRGLKKGSGLNAELAKLLNVSPATMSRKARRYLQPQRPSP
jgi:hypothetical protein